MQAATTTYDRFQPDDVPQYETVMRQAFARNSTLAAYLRGSVGPANIRVMRAGGGIAGMLAMLPMAQFFGGRAVPSTAIGNVAVPPAWRGRGVAKAMIRAMLEESRADGMALSTLYPSSLAVYRRLGYEAAGIRTKYAIAPDHLAEVPQRLELAPAGRAELPILQRLHALGARHNNGWIDRSKTLWQRKLEPFDTQIDGYLVHAGSGDANGYMLVRHTDLRTLDIIDWCALDGDAARQILSFIGGSRAVVRKATWDGGPEDLLNHLVPDQGVTIDLSRQWTLRIVDAVRALSERGYPQQVETTLTFDITDALLPWNSGCFRLEISEGRGEATPCSTAAEPRLRLDVSALAPLYSGYLPPQSLAVLGRIEGSEEALQRAALVFGGPKPWMTDEF